MLEHDMPILEFDPDRNALISPGRHPAPDFPKHAVACFFNDVFQHLIEQHNAIIIRNLRSEIGDNPVYRIEINNQPLAVFHPGVGAPLAAGYLEEIIGLGATNVLACGGAGVLDSNITLGHLIVPTSAVRDEGTSYHYLPPTREVGAHPAAVAVIEKVLQAHQVAYLLGKTWTTDAFYRETPARIKRRRDEGCLSVEMEASAFFAVAQFRSIVFGQILYGGDDLGGEIHDHRDWDKQMSVREQAFWLTAEACLLL